MLVGYARISTSDQSPALQRDALEEAGCGRILEETAAGARRERPQVQSALDWMREGDTLVVWRLDRLARSMRQLIETVEDLDERGIGFSSLTEAIDTTTPGGRLFFHVFGALAEFERSLIVERTRAGLNAAKARDRVGGRPRLTTAPSPWPVHSCETPPIRSAGWRGGSAYRGRRSTATSPAAGTAFSPGHQRSGRDLDDLL